MKRSGGQRIARRRGRRAREARQFMRAALRAGAQVRDCAEDAVFDALNFGAGFYRLGFSPASYAEQQGAMPDADYVRSILQRPGYLVAFGSASMEWL